MNSDFTQQQSLGGLERAEALSLQSTLPPSEVEGYRLEKLLGQGVSRRDDGIAEIIFVDDLASGCLEHAWTPGRSG